MIKNNKKTMKTLVFSLGLVALLLTSTNLNAQYDGSRGLFGLGGSSADYEYSTRDGLIGINDNTGGSTNGIQNDSFGTPLGSGIAILLAAGAGYAVVRRKRSRKNTMLLLACVALLGFTQCKKEQPLEPTNDANTTMITLNVDNGGNNGSRVNVSGADVTFTNGDKILVAYDGKYVGTITHNGTNFSGNITATQNGDQPLYFYFLGNKFTGTLTEGTTTSCTIDISSQSTELPVLSFSESNEYFTGSGSYTANLHNQCALVKFTMENTIGSVSVGGMHTEATINFATPSITPTETTGEIHLFSKTSTEKWAILLPQDAVASAPVATVCQTDLTVSVPKITAGEFITGIPAIANNETTATDLASLTDNYTASDNEILYGTLGGNYKISIAAGATVMLDEVNINGNGTWKSNDWAGITCNSNANIVLYGYNIIKSFSRYQPGIKPGGSGTTLTIGGTGSLDVSCNQESGGDAAGIGGDFSSYSRCGDITIESGTIVATGGNFAAGIGSGSWNHCGNITITGGTITAYGGLQAAGIGTGEGQDGEEGWEDPEFGYMEGTDSKPSTCGNITISGGTVIAIGGNRGAGIGTGFIGNCGNITITDGVTCITATKGSSAQHSIGRGNDGSYFQFHEKEDFNVTIGGSSVGYISDSPYTYQP